MRNYEIIIFISTILFSTKAFAIDFEDAVFPELAPSGRALAMGNAYVAKADDSSAVYYNPAGLGSIRKTHLHLSNFHIELNKGFFRLGAGGKASDVPSNLPNAFSLDGTRQLLVGNEGKISHSKFSFLPNFTTRYFSLGYLLNKQQRATIGLEDGANFEYASRLDHGPFVALNFSLFGGVFKIGASTTFLNRKEAIGESAAGETIELESNDYRKGSAVIIVTGVKLTLPIAFLPTFAVKFNNSAQQDFSQRAAGQPTNIKNSMDVGFSLTPQIGNTIRMHLEINWKDMSGDYDGVATNRKITMGSEIDFARIFFFRFGYGDGFGSAGLGIKSQSLEFDLTTYAVDTSANEFRGREDRRFSMSFSYGF